MAEIGKAPGAAWRHRSAQFSWESAACIYGRLQPSLSKSAACKVFRAPWLLRRTNGTCSTPAHPHALLTV